MTYPLNLGNLDLVSFDTASLKKNSSISLLTWNSLFFTFPWFGPKFGDFFKLLWLILKILEILDRKTRLPHPLNLGNLDLVSSVPASLKENSSILLPAWKSLFFTFTWIGPKFGDFFYLLRLVLKILEILDRKTWLTHPLNLGNLDLGSSVPTSLKENSSILLLAWKYLSFYISMIWVKIWWLCLNFVTNSQNIGDFG